MDKFYKILTSLEKDLKKVNEIILEFSNSRSPLTKEIATHLISSGGKRIRPVLLILVAKMFGYKNGSQHHNLASAVELIHNATLLHDDVVDASLMRRGKKTANAIWNNKASILVGDYLFSIAFQLMTKNKNLEILELLAKTSSIMADGEVMQLENSNNIEISEKKYYEIIFGKTAILFSAACKVGSMIGTKNKNYHQKLANFGKNLGIIFQIVDDFLDYYAEENLLGKTVGDDFFEGKITLPIILTYQNANIDDKKIIRDIFLKNIRNSVKSKKDFKIITSLMNKYSIKEKITHIIRKYQTEAISSIKDFKNNSSKKSLMEIVEYSAVRVS
jgi:octaprenyl-diphosphate synthase